MENTITEIGSLKGGEIELGEISKSDLISCWSSGKKYNYKGKDYLVSKYGGAKNDFFFEKNGKKYILLLDKNKTKYFPIVVHKTK